MCQGQDSLEKHFMLPLIFSSLLNNLLWIKYNVQWNVSIIINEATREYISYRYVSHSRSFPPVLVPLFQNNNIQVLEEEFPLHFLCNIWQAKKFFRISCESHVTALAKHKVKNLNDHAISKISGRIKDKIINLNKGGM